MGTHSLSCQSRGKRQQAGSAASDPEVGTHSLSFRSLGKRQQAGSAARGLEMGTHSLPRQSPRRASAIWQRGKGSRRELTSCHVNPPGESQQAGSVARDPEERTHMLSCQFPRRTLASRQRGKGSGRGNSLPVISIPHANVSELAAWQAIGKGGTHMLSCQSRRRTLESRQRGKGPGRGNAPAVMPIPQADVSEPAARQGIWKGALTSYHVNPSGER